jgi:acyl-CoA thioesterase FadM
MAILHTPRTLISIGRGLLRRRRQRLAAINANDVDVDADEDGAINASKFIGFVPRNTNNNNNNNNNESNRSNNNNNNNPHIYKNKPSILFDIDYLGHMNNSAFLAHAEYARWEWTAETGLLETMFSNKINFIVTSSSIRYRKEILINNKFEIHSILKSINERNIYMYQTFRSSATTNDGNGNGGRGGRILAQVLVQAVVTQNRKVIQPKQVLENMGLSNDIINSLLLLNNNSNNPSLLEDNGMDDDNDDDNDDDDGDCLLLKRFEELDKSFRVDATNDDKQLNN